MKNSNFFVETSTSAYVQSSIVPSSNIFVLTSASSSAMIVVHSNSSLATCEMLHPCQNNGTCVNLNSTIGTYNCTCPSDFGGDQCQIDYRPCKIDTCLNNGISMIFYSRVNATLSSSGICQEISNRKFTCICTDGRSGDRCETMINYCEDVECMNNAICRPLLLNYSCECLTSSYSGHHCEIVSTSLTSRQMISKSFGYIAIVMIIVVVLFIIIMDVLKYGFGIDPNKDKLAKNRRMKVPKKRRHPPVITRFTYVNAPPEESVAIKNVETNVNIEQNNI